MADEEEKKPDLTEELIQARVEIERLKAKTSTTLTGTEFLTLLFVLPIILSFVILGVIIVWKWLRIWI